MERKVFGFGNELFGEWFGKVWDTAFDDKDIGLKGYIKIVAFDIIIC